MTQLDLFIDVDRKEIDTECVDISTLPCDIVPDTRYKKGIKNTMDLVLLVPEGKFIAYKTGAYHPNRLDYPDPTFPYLVNTYTGKEVGIFLTRNDYPSINISLSGTSSDRSMVSVSAHKLFAWCFVYNPDQDVQIVVDHINSDKHDYSIKNLEWVSQHENQRRNKK